MVISSNGHPGRCSKPAALEIHKSSMGTVGGAVRRRWTDPGAPPSCPVGVHSRGPRAASGPVLSSSVGIVVPPSRPGRSRSPSSGAFIGFGAAWSSRWPSTVTRPTPILRGDRVPIQRRPSVPTVTVSGHPQGFPQGARPGSVDGGHTTNCRSGYTRLPLTVSAQRRGHGPSRAMDAVSATRTAVQVPSTVPLGVEALMASLPARFAAVASRNRPSAVRRRTAGHGRRPAAQSTEHRVATRAGRVSASRTRTRHTSSDYRNSDYSWRGPACYRSAAGWFRKIREPGDPRPFIWQDDHAGPCGDRQLRALRRRNRSETGLRRFRRGGGRLRGGDFGIPRRPESEDQERTTTTPTEVGTATLRMARLLAAATRRGGGHHPARRRCRGPVRTGPPSRPSSPGGVQSSIRNTGSVRARTVGSAA